MPNDHPITISPAEGRVVVRWHGHTIVDTTHALRAEGARIPRRLLRPARGRRDGRFFDAHDSQTKCPYKGTANYFTLKSGADLDANAVWTYETPIAGVAAIKEYLAFYPDKVEITPRTPS